MQEKKTFLHIIIVSLIIFVNYWFSQLDIKTIVWGGGAITLNLYAVL